MIDKERGCSAPGCDNAFRARGLCASHYARLTRGLDLYAPMQGRGTVAERFWPKVRKSDGCWEWTASKNRSGYGVLGRPEGSRLAHRISFELAYGEVPAGMDVDHICRNPSCVRPDHLRAATRAENVQNRSGATRTSRSGVRGVRKFGNRWQARAQMGGKAYSLGYFATLEEASNAASAWRAANMPYSELDKESEVA